MHQRHAFHLGLPKFRHMESLQGLGNWIYLQLQKQGGKKNGRIGWSEALLNPPIQYSPMAVKTCADWGERWDQLKTQLT